MALSTRALMFPSRECRRLMSSVKIYTKTGDKGKTSNYAGQRLPKDDRIFEALGATDELTSALGLAREFCEEQGHKFGSQLETIQCDLQDVGSNIATPRTTSSEERLAKTAFSASRAGQLEKWIDSFDAQLPPLKNFILPSGGKTAASLHVTRAICRRAERRVVPLRRDGLVDPEVQIYLNRLSDYLFTVARFAAKEEGRTETVYRRSTS